jgi:hypothetical protein
MININCFFLSILVEVKLEEESIFGSFQISEKLKDRLGELIS